MQAKREERKIGKWEYILSTVVEGEGEREGRAGGKQVEQARLVEACVRWDRVEKGQKYPHSQSLHNYIILCYVLL